MAEAAAVIDSSPEKRRSKERGIEDYKRKIWKLKKELEEQKEMLTKQRHDEQEKLRAELLLEREEAVETLKREMTQDLLQMGQKFKDKESQLTESLQQKEAEISKLKQSLGGHENEVKVVKSTIESAHHETVTKLQKEIRHLQQLNNDLQQKYQHKHSEYKNKVAELKAAQDEAEAERQKLLNDALSAKLHKVKRDQDSGTKLDSHRERELTIKVNELTTALKRLEKRSNLLTQENTTLKKNESQLKDLQEQNAKFKKRNSELAQIASKQDKTKSVTQKPAHSGQNQTDSKETQNLEHARKMFARQRAKDFAEHAKVLLSKDNEIEKLRKRALLLSDNINNTTRESVKENQFDMSAVLRQSTKEKLLLEAKAKGNTSDDNIESKAALFNLQIDYDSLQEKYTELTSTNSRLETQLQQVEEQLRLTSENKEKTNKEMTTLRSQCESTEQKYVQLNTLNGHIIKERDQLDESVKQLTDEVSKLNHQREQLSQQVEKLTRENYKLTSELRELQLLSTYSEELKRDNQEMTEELEELKEKVSEYQKAAAELREDKVTAANEMKTLLEEKELFAAEVATWKENSLTELKQKTDDFDILKTQHDDCLFKIEETERQMGDKNSEIRRCEKEMEDLKAELAEGNDTRQILMEQLHQKEVLIDELKEMITHLQSSLSQELSLRNDKQESLADSEKQVELMRSQLCDQKDSLSVKEEQMRKQTDEISLLNDRIRELEETIKSFKLEVESLKSQILEKEECHKELTETLEKKDSELVAITSSATDFEAEISQLEEEKKELLLEKRKLEEVVAVKEIEKASCTTQISKLARDLDKLQAAHQDINKNNEVLKSQCGAAEEKLAKLRTQYSYLQSEYDKQKEDVAQLQDEKELIELKAKNELETEKDELTLVYEKQLEELNSQMQESQQANSHLKSRIQELESAMEDNKLHQISVYAGENCYHLYVARLAYDPTVLNDSDSTNSSPSKCTVDRSGTDSALSATDKLTEISVNPGDYVFVSGEITEEGYYEGRLLDGRVGYVPSNVLEPLYEFDIYGFVVATDPDEEDDVDADNASVSAECITQSHKAYSFLPSTTQTSLPYPRKLTLERQFTNSILVGWQAPEGNENILMYNIYVDDKHRASLSSKVKCKALVEGVKALQSHRVAVTAVTSTGESDKRHCTIIIGEPNNAPTELRVSAVDADTAVLSFIPHNSNQYHIIYVNQERVRNLAPSLYSLEIGGLISNTEYEVTIVPCDQITESMPSRISSADNISIRTAISMCFTFAAPDESKDGEVMADCQSLDASYLHKFDKFLEEVVNGSPTPPVNRLMDLREKEEMETIDYLKGSTVQENNSNHPSGTIIDTTTAVVHSNGHTTTDEDMIHCSTPKTSRQVRALRPSELVDNISPVVTGLSDNQGEDNSANAPNLKLQNGKTTPRSVTSAIEMKEDRAKSPDMLSPSSTPGKAGALSLHEDQTSSVSERVSMVEDNPSTVQAPASNPHLSRLSPLQNKQNLQKMLKSLTNSSKDIQRSRSKSGSRRITDESPDNSPSKSTENSFGRSKESEDMSIKELLSAGQDSLVKQRSEVGYKSKKVRTFIALYDYNPAEMSPNPDAVSSELGFSKGDLLEVFGHKDADGFYSGQNAHGKHGFIPSNLIKRHNSASSASATDQQTSSSNSSPEKPSPSKSSTAAAVTEEKNIGKILDNQKSKQRKDGRRMRALYDYDPSTLSPNEDSHLELKFSQGDIITVTGDMDDVGFYRGKVAGKTGLVPSNFLEPV